jgi:translation initiation factor 4A
MEKVSASKNDSNELKEDLKEDSKKNSKNYEVDIVNSFDELNLKDKLLRGIYSNGFEKPSVIQQRAIKPMIEKYDMIAQSQSGTGKTGTFSISALQLLEEENKECQVIIIVNTRELADQVNQVITKLSSYMDVKTALCVGGSSVLENKNNLENAQIVVGTPGRIIDLQERRYLNTSDVKLLILDEADELLSTGFLSQLKQLINCIPGSSQICLFSATLPEKCLEITSLFMNDPLKILIKKDQLTLEGIKQFYVNVERDDWKLDTLIDLYGHINTSQSLIYVNRKTKAKWLHNKLTEENFTTAVIHSELNQTERTDIMNKFRDGSSRVLISTDLLARGIDVQQVSVVINFDIPNDRENYIHRIGRSGRFGRKGIAINFVTSKDYSRLKDIEEFYHTFIEEMPMDIQRYF